MNQPRHPNAPAVCQLTSRLLTHSVLWFAILASALALIGTAVGQTRTSGVIGAGKPWQTPFYVVDSGADGPTVIVTGGVHGNEPAGFRAAEQIRHWPIVRGKLIVVPRVNTRGLQQNSRMIPGAPVERQDLNRNFPDPGSAEEPRGELAKAVWQFVVKREPDWLFDLHEGYEFNVSHKPPAGKTKSVGSSIIYSPKQSVGPLVERMLTAANRTVTDPARRLVPLDRGPKRTTLASAVIHVLGAKAMTVETTFKQQRLHVRTRQHRLMMNVALRHLGLIERDCVDVLTPPKGARGEQVYVALYDDAGGTEGGVRSLTRAFDADPKITTAHLGAADIRPEVLAQFDVVVFGGGSGSKEAATIGKPGAAAVREFVRDGGGYVGVCAGAYLCSAHYSWSLNLIDTHVFTGTKTVAGVARQMWYRGKSTEQKMQLTAAGSELFEQVPEHVRVRYHNGPIVSPKHHEGLKPYTVLAYFRSEKVLHPPQKGTMVNTPAIVRGDFGQGRVISISPHPESTQGLRSMVSQAVHGVAPERTEN